MLINSLEILNKMNPNQKINYDNVLKKMIQTWELQETKPRVLIHSCCAPCSTYTLEYLSNYCDVTIYFANSNIHPRSEYQRRMYEQQKFIAAFNEETNQHVSFLAADYVPNEYMKVVAKGLENEPEGGLRCQGCFEYRLDLTAQTAQDLGFDYFGSALTISPMKNSQLINSLGVEVQELYSVAYLPSDFKKNNGYKRSVQMCHEYDVYRQCYCGCIFAATDQGIDMKAINKEASAYMVGKDNETAFPQIQFHYAVQSNQKGVENNELSND